MESSRERRHYIRSYGSSHDIVRIWATTDARNVRSRRVLEKLGMQLEGYLRSHGLARDGRTDEVWYGLLRKEWLAPG